MRTKEDVNLNQCDKCGKIDKNEDLACWDGEDEYEGLALCGKCIKELKPSQKTGKLEEVK